MTQRSLKDFELIIFDLDGTIADTLEDITTSVNETLAEFSLSKLQLKEVRKLIGSGVPSLMQGALATHNKFKIDKASKLFLSNYSKNLLKKTKLYSGILKLLNKIKSKKLAIVTNKPQKHTKKLLDAFDISKYFQIVYGGDTFKQKKPHPKPIKNILKKLKIKNSDALLVGDGVNDILAANAANIACASIGYGYCDKEELLAFKPNYYFESVSELYRSF